MTVEDASYSDSVLSGHHWTNQTHFHLIPCPRPGNEGS